MTTLPARYRITHRTHYSYSDAVAICQNQLRMQPRSSGRVTVHASTISIQPKPDSIFEHKDYFGNQVCSFAIESHHRQLKVVASSDVSVAPIDLPTEMTQMGATSFDNDPPWEMMAEQAKTATGISLRAVEFRFDSPRVTASETYAAYAKKSFTPGRGLMASTLDLTRRIHADFKYDTTATDVDTPTDKAFYLRAGVCQDFAHVQIACLRSIGLPTRYVSGYLRTIPPPGQPRAIGADESHAWLSVYAGKDRGWLACDPTNACFVGTHHIPICVGRDYSDVSPMRGVVLGGGTTSLKVSVNVEPVDPETGLPMEPVTNNAASTDPLTGEPSLGDSTTTPKPR